MTIYIKIYKKYIIVKNKENVFFITLYKDKVNIPGFITFNFGQIK